MPEYYTGTCKGCGKDCDDKFCSWACKEEWEEGYAEYLYDQARDVMAEEEYESGLKHKVPI